MKNLQPRHISNVWWVKWEFCAFLHAAKNVGEKIAVCEEYIVSLNKVNKLSTAEQLDWWCNFHRMNLGRLLTGNESRTKNLLNTNSVLPECFSQNIVYPVWYNKWWIHPLKNAGILCVQGSRGHSEYFLSNSKWIISERSKSLETQVGRRFFTLWVFEGEFAHLWPKCGLHDNWANYICWWRLWDGWTPWKK